MKKTLNLVVGIDNSKEMFFFVDNLKKALGMFIDVVIKDYESIQLLLVSDSGIVKTNLSSSSNYVIDFERMFVELKFVKKINMNKFLRNLIDATLMLKNKGFTMLFSNEINEKECDFLKKIKATIFVSRNCDKDNSNFIKIDFDKVLPDELFTVINAEYQMHKNG